MTHSCDKQEQFAALTDEKFQVRKRDGRLVPFTISRISAAIEKALQAESVTMKRELFELLLMGVLQKIQDRFAHEGGIEVEQIQNCVEDQLMDQGLHEVARGYILYREAHRQARSHQEFVQEHEHKQEKVTSVILSDGSIVSVTSLHLKEKIVAACAKYPHLTLAEEIYKDLLSSIYDGVSVEELDQAIILTTRSRIERDPDYSYVASELLLDVIYRKIFNKQDPKENYQSAFTSYIQEGVRLERLDPALLSFDLSLIQKAIQADRDSLFQYLGLQTVFDRYLIQHHGRLLETPQFFWMRVAMGLSLKEGEEREEQAIRFYNVLSQFHFVSSTPTLFNSGTRHSQMSSCYLSTVKDDLDHIFKVIGDNARLSKWSGGIGNDWTNVRATGAIINGTHGLTQGVVPFLKVSNDTAVAVNQGGKRKGAFAAYLETWHLDVLDFLELRKNTGDERRRTHDMNTANWIPDLFMKRMLQGKEWTLFNPSDVPDLHDIYGKAFERRYEHYEAMVEKGKIKLFKKIDAVQMWRKMLSMLFETGHPWITFKDPSNIRSMQDHAGVVHSSNLCTEILLNTSETETAVCNLGSINLVAHLKDGALDEKLIKETVQTAIRMLDNVIDINYYPTIEAQNSNLRHRPIGMGIMGFHDSLYALKLNYSSQDAIDFADYSMECISYEAILASAELASLRGPYSSYRGSKWDRGLLPIDTIRLLEEERGEFCDFDSSTKRDWRPVREAVKKHGMRNSHCMAIAPTATISNIVGVSSSIDPTYAHLFVKSNLSGEFAVLNTYLVNDLKELGLWDDEMLDDLKYLDGSIQEIDRVPDDLKERYRTAFEIEPSFLIDCGSKRQKWIDMGQSLNLYIATPSGKKLNEMYTQAWIKGLKTTYYLRATAATQIEKSTVDINKRGLQPRWMKNLSASSRVVVDREEPKACRIDDPTCESCQ